MALTHQEKPIVAHLIYRFDIGGLERVMVNCINAMDSERYQHVIIALTEVAEQTYPISQNVSMYSLHKRAGNDLSIHWKLFKLLRKIKPAILHSYNLATIEYHPVSYLAGVKGHIHAEHGRDVSDPQGLNKKHLFLRKLLSPFIDFFVPVSQDLSTWLAQTAKISNKKIAFIRNGINIDSFYHQKNSVTPLTFVHVARLDKVKDQANLITAFSLLINQQKLSYEQVKLTIVGDGAELQNLVQLAEQLSITEFIEFAGAQNNVADWLANADVFVLSSIAEGIPMTVLEAMASSLPVISTDVGGLSELIQHNENGQLVQKQNSQYLCDAMSKYVNSPQLIKTHGTQAKAFVEHQFSEQTMVAQYLGLYQQSLGYQDVGSDHVRN